MCSTSLVRTCSRSTRTPTSIEVRQAALTVARTVTRSPTSTGWRKIIRSTPAVTTRHPEWRIAAIPATSSQRDMIRPPWMLPAVLASPTPVQRVRTETESDGGRGGGAIAAG